MSQSLRLSANLSAELFDSVVIGAGISGLSAAYTLQQAGKRVLVLEASKNPGGLIRSKTQDGYTLDLGPHTFPGTATQLLGLCQKLGLRPVPVSKSSQHRFVYHRNRLFELPHSAWSAVTTPLLSIKAKLRLLQEPWVAVGKEDDETLASFVTRRFGAEVQAALLDPLVTGIYGGSTERLSAEAVFPNLLRLERHYGSVLKGLLSKRKQQASKAPAVLYGFENGLAEFPQALAQALSNRVLYAQPVTSISQTAPDRYACMLASGTMVHTKSIVLATPAYVAGDLLGGVLDPSACDILKSVFYAPMAVVHLGFSPHQCPHVPQGFGTLVASDSHDTLLGVLYNHSMFANRAPGRHVLLSCFVGGSQHPERLQESDEALVAACVEDLSRILSIELPQPHIGFSHVVRYARAIPQAQVGWLERRSTLQRQLAPWPTLALCGNYWGGISLNDCVKGAQQAAGRVLEAI